MATEVTSEFVFMSDLRVAGVSPTVARPVFEANGLDWQDFTQNGIATSALEPIDNAIAQKIVKSVKNDARPIQVKGEIRVYMRHVRAAKVCSKGSREFFKKHGLDWNDFLTHGIPVKTLEEIGDPIALRAAQEAVEEEANGRR